MVERNRLVSMTQGKVSTPTHKKIRPLKRLECFSLRMSMDSVSVHYGLKT